MLLLPVESHSVLPETAVTTAPAPTFAPVTVIPTATEAVVGASREVPAFKNTGVESVSNVPPEMFWML